ncbi:MAG: methyltransferase domain-containing protein [Actinomycetota bacterium]|nr:methyltransferase domain-containing protein [Actinomycetota bacterium]
MEERLYELPFDQFQRYKVVEEIVNLARDDKPLKILDVGGYPGLISDFLPNDETYILDVASCERPNYIRGDGTSLPFTDGAFDVVSSLDVYEHIPTGERDRFIDEICRVSRDLVILSAPFKNRDVELVEKVLYEYVARVFGEFPTLKEHIDRGLPDLDDLLHRLENKGLLVINFPSGYLYNWLVMMLVKHYIMATLNSQKVQAQFDKLYNVHFSHDEFRSPSYRQVVVASKVEGESFLKKLAGEFRPTETSAEEVGYRLQLFQMLLDLLNLQVSQQLTAQEAYIRELEQKAKAQEKKIAPLEKQILAMEKTLELKEQHIANLEKFAIKVKATLLYKLYSLIKRSFNRARARRI